MKVCYAPPTIMALAESLLFLEDVARSKQHSFPNPEKIYIIYKIIIFLELIRDLKSQDNQVNLILNKDKPHPKEAKTYKLIHLRQSMGHTSNKWVKRNQLNLTNS